MSGMEKKFEMKPNSGSLWKNEDKTEDKHPDYKGKILIEGVGEKDIGAWIKVKKDGKTKFLALRISEPWKPTKQRAPQDKPLKVHMAGEFGKSNDDFNDEIPF